MTRYCGAVGYAISTETSPGVWEDVITERIRRGDIVQNSKRWEPRDKVNDNLTLNASISIVADAFDMTHFLDIKYVEWLGRKWEVAMVTVERPRLIFTLSGGVYNGPTP